MEFDDLKYAQRERLFFLDRCLTWRGAANRRDLVSRFGISTAQAALDFRLYLERAIETPPIYDPARKTYLAAEGHKPLAPSSLVEAFEIVLDAEDDYQSATLPAPARQADRAIVSRLHQAMKFKRAIHIEYTSMTSGAIDGQWIAPTHFSSDGESVHLRAFSFKHMQYRNYLPIRIAASSTFETKPPADLLPPDDEWNTRVKIWLRPRSDLTREQASAVRREYGFTGDLLCVETRKALEFFLDRRWGLNQPGARLERVGADYEPG